MLANLIQSFSIKRLLDKDKEKIRIEVDETETVNLLNNIIQDKDKSIQKLQQQIDEYESGEVVAKLRKELEYADARLSTILK
jgi:site-specific DNA-adenine methylase